MPSIQNVFLGMGVMTETALKGVFIIESYVRRYVAEWYFFPMTSTYSGMGHTVFQLLGMGQTENHTTGECFRLWLTYPTGNESDCDYPYCKETGAGDYVCSCEVHLCWGSVRCYQCPVSKVCWWDVNKPVVEEDTEVQVTLWPLV